MSHVFAKKKTRGILRFRPHIARHKRSGRARRARTHRRNSMQVFETFSEEETYALGKRTGETATPDTVYALSGDLGVGKTVFTKGVAAGLGITEPVTSPTFTIVQSYHGGRLPFFHFDVYRISDIDEMEEIGYDDCFFGGGVTIVEWAEFIEELMPENTIHIRIEKDLSKGPDMRRITFE